MALLSSREVSGILQRGGTVLQTARNEEFKTAGGQRKGKRRLNENGIEGVIVIGGDGSLRGALALHRMGVPVIGIPASIDNDIWGTRYQHRRRYRPQYHPRCRRSPARYRHLPTTAPSSSKSWGAIAATWR